MFLGLSVGEDSEMMSHLNVGKIMGTINFSNNLSETSDIFQIHQNLIKFNLNYCNNELQVP